MADGGTALGRPQALPMVVGWQQQRIEALFFSFFCPISFYKIHRRCLGETIVLGRVERMAKNVAIFLTILYLFQMDIPTYMFETNFNHLTKMMKDSHT